MWLRAGQDRRNSGSLSETPEVQGIGNPALSAWEEELKGETKAGAIRREKKSGELASTEALLILHSRVAFSGEGS